MARARKKHRQSSKAARPGLSVGAGSSAAVGLAADDGFERVHVVDADGMASTPQRRVDNLQRLERALGADRVHTLRLLRDAADAVEVGVAGRSALDMSPRTGSLEGAMGMRIDAARRFDAAWAAVPEGSRDAVRRVVLEGWGCHRLAAQRGGRNWVTKARINTELREAADAIAAWVDARFGRARMRWCWDTPEAA